MAPPTKREQAEDRLRYDTPYFALNCLKIVTKGAELVPLVYRPWQQRLYEVKKAQREEGKPCRIIILKARQMGFSTETQADFIQACTQRDYQRGLVVGHTKDTASSLFRMGQIMFEHLPIEVKPDTVSNRRRHGMDFANGSSIQVDTANEVEAGRGFTYTQLHCSEFAFWPHISKLTALVNAVPDEPGTTVVLESTANGMNFMRDRWERAMSGDSDFYPFFAPWHETPEYALRFVNDEEKAEFVSSIGEGEWGEDEKRLVEKFGCSPEQLHWRRRAIVDKADADLEVFKAEYPAEAEEAFRATGKTVFSPQLITKVLDRCETTDSEHKRGIYKPTTTKDRRSRTGMTVEVPQGSMWVPEEATGFARTHPFWRKWEDPKEGEQYVVGVDVAGGEETTKGETAWHAIEVVNHKTLEQVAEYRSRIDPDELALEALYAALSYNEAWLVIEVTGGWGGPVVRRLRHEYAYRFLYYRPDIGSKNEKQSDRLGWDTNRRSKPMLENDLREQLREGTDGIKSSLLANELTTYIKDERGKSGPDDGKFSDLLMAYMIAQSVSREKPIRSERRRAKKWASTGNETVGY